jgi:hypothetical protein
MPAKFTLGKLVATPGALEALATSGENAAKYISRHVAGDFGDIDQEDKRLNDEAIEQGERILSAYVLKTDERIWIITEADRSSTCILLPSEY